MVRFERMGQQSLFVLVGHMLSPWSVGRIAGSHDFSSSIYQHLEKESGGLWAYTFSVEINTTWKNVLNEPHQPTNGLFVWSAIWDDSTTAFSSCPLHEKYRTKRTQNEQHPTSMMQVNMTGQRQRFKKVSMWLACAVSASQKFPCLIFSHI